MQRRAVLYISGIFCTSPTLGIKAIAGLIYIHLHLQKLNGKSYLRVHSLLLNHIIKSILKTRSSNNIEPHQLLLESLMSRQQVTIKGPIVDMNNRFNENFLFFSPFNCEFSLGNRLIDIFPNHFSFHSLNRKSNHNVKSQLCKLDSITLQMSSNLYSVVVVIDTNIKNQVTISSCHVNITCSYP